jgi:LysM repeat protein
MLITQIRRGLKAMRIPVKKGTLAINGRFYVVQFGDSLYLISQRFGVSVTDILSYNDQLSGDNLLFTGEVLFIPKPHVTEVKQKSKGKPRSK